MCVKDLFSSYSWLPVIFGWIYQMCLFRDFCSRPWIREAPFKILVLSLSWHSANGGCGNNSRWGGCAVEDSGGEGGSLEHGPNLIGSSHNVCLQLGSSTSNPKHDTTQKSSCFLLTAVCDCENFQPWRPGMERMAGRCSWSRLCGSHHAPQEVVTHWEVLLNL